MTIFNTFTPLALSSRFGALTFDAARCDVPFYENNFSFLNNFSGYNAGFNPFALNLPLTAPNIDFTNQISYNNTTTTSFLQSLNFNLSMPNWANNLTSNIASWSNPIFSYNNSLSFINPIGDTFSLSSLPAVSYASISNSAVKNISWWKAQGYNEEKGKQLAANTKRHSDYLHAQHITGQCGQGVRKGINDTFYNGTTHYTSFGAARLTGSDYLAHDSHFKKVDISGMHLSKEDIPAGAIVIYDSGYSSGGNSHLGHIEVSDGNGHGYSDLTTTLLQNWGRRKEPKEIWIPV